jgi:hypothetical protein
LRPAAQSTACRLLSALITGGPAHAASEKGKTPAFGLSRNCEPRALPPSAKETACVENARGYVHLNRSQDYVSKLVKVTAKVISVAGTVAYGFGAANSRTVNADEIAELGPITEYVTATIQGGPKALRAAQRQASRLSKRFGIEFEAQWLLKTPWLEAWARGEHPISQRHPNATVVQLGSTASRLRVRAMMATRARFLTFLAILGSRYAACRKAKVSHQDINYHLDNDHDFAAQAEVAKAYFTDLLHMRAMQRAIEGDCEPVYWQGIEVGHIRKFDSRLQIELLRAHTPDKFKTPGTGSGVHVDNAEKVLVLTEEARAKLMAANRERIMALPDYIDTTPVGVSHSGTKS